MWSKLTTPKSFNPIRWSPLKDRDLTNYYLLQVTLIIKNINFLLRLKKELHLVFKGKNHRFVKSLGKRCPVITYGEFYVKPFMTDFCRTVGI